MTTPINFTVLGLPVPEGSLKSYGYGLTHTNEKQLLSWRHDVASAAFQNRPDDWDVKAPVELHCEFVFPRPMGDFGTGRNAGTIKASAPKHHTKRPDTDKLTRSIGDAISVKTKVLLNDDSQIVSINSTKRYADINEPAHAQITVIPLAA